MTEARTTATAGSCRLFDAEPVVAPYPEATSRDIWWDHALGPPGTSSEEADRGG